MQPLLFVAALAGAIAYPFVEARWYRVNVLDASWARGGPPLDILHVSDTHLTARDNTAISFLRSLPRKISVPDLVIATGDLIEDNSGIAPVTDALNALPAKLGRYYILGSHDYYQSRFQSYLKYFTRPDGSRRSRRADTRELERRLEGAGWVSLTNGTGRLETDHGLIRLGGVDDPYLDPHTTGHIERSRDEVLAIGLAHSPDVASEWALNGFDIVFAGHTHAGQVRFPGIGALVTNSDLPAALAGGLHRIGDTWLHVSPGLGTGRFAPIRFNCRPEVTLLHLS